MDLSALPSHLLVSTLKKVNWQILVYEGVNGFSISNTCPFSEEFEPFFALFCKRYAGFCFGAIITENRGFNRTLTITEKEIKIFEKIVTILADNDISCYEYVARFSLSEEVFTKLKPMSIQASKASELWKYTEKCGRHTSIRFCGIDISDLLLALDGRCDNCECITMEIPRGCEEIVFLKLLEFMKMRKAGKRCRRLIAEYCSWSTAVIDVPDFYEKFLNQEDFEVKPLKANRRFKARGYKLVYKRLIYNGELGTTVARLAYGKDPDKYNVFYFDCLDFDGKETTFPGKPFPMNILELNCIIY